MRRPTCTMPPPFRCWVFTVLMLCTAINLLIPQLVIGVELFSPQIIAIQKMLLSRVTNNTPISGFYGPGAWWAFLVTIGMTHGHTIMVILRTGHLPSEWDYDLIAASSYTVAAAIDLIYKSNTIAQLGDKASESSLLPALVCAERAVELGSGASLFTLAAALIYGRPYRLHTIGIAAIPPIFALVASRFCLHAHQAISRTAPVFWCLHVDGPNNEPWVVPVGVDFPAVMGETIPSFLQLYTIRALWLLMAGLGGVIIVAIFVVCLVMKPNLEGALLAALGALATPFCVAIGFLLVPLMGISVILVAIGSTWVFLWITLWLLVYILAFFPQIKFFPPTTTSILEMDQIAALLAVCAVAAIRTLRAIFKAVHPSAHSLPAETPVPI
ncbi:hypothetical protein B0H11DRAFT_2031896 [Mycena galericulata]|nr:hypothetical protein B0H11DRAFT_2031896 [Mycena galericulata]